jgi:lipopolysaccharide export system permease protein
MINLRMKRVDRLVALTVLGAVLMAWLVIVGFEALLFLMHPPPSVVGKSPKLSFELIYLLMTMPRRLYEWFSIAALIGGLTGLGGLAASAELTALRAAGMSKLRIATSVVGLVALLTLGVVILGETAAPLGDQRAQNMSMQARAGDLGANTSSGYWARDGHDVINAKRVVADIDNGRRSVQMLDVRVYSLTDDGQLTSMDVAKSARHIDGRWILSDVQRTTLDDKGVHAANAPSMVWNSRLSPDVLAQSIIHPEYLSMRDLHRTMAYKTSLGESPGVYAVSFWGRVLYPLNALVLVLCAMPFAFGSLRSGGLGKRMFIGILMAIGWYFLQKALVSFGTVYGLPPLLANLLPPLVLVVAAWLYFRKNG